MSHINQMPLLFDHTLKNAYIIGKDLPKSVKDRLCSVKSQKNRFEKDGGIEGAPLLKEKVKGAPGAYGSVRQGHTKGYEARSYQLNINVAKEDIDDAMNVTEQATDYGAYLRRSQFHFEESLGADLINQGFVTTTYSTGDGVAIFSNSHVYSNGQTWDNLETGAFSATVLKALIFSIRHRRGAFGEPLNMGMSKLRLFYANGVDDVVYELLKSSGKPGTSDNNLNYFAGEQIEAIRAPYFTGSQVVLQDASTPSELQYRLREKFSVAAPVEDKIARAFTYSVNGRVAVGATYALGLAATQG